MTSEQKAVTSIAQALGKKYRLRLDDEVDPVGVRLVTFRCLKVYSATAVNGTQLLYEAADIPPGADCKARISELLGYGVKVLCRIYPTPWEGHEAWWLGEYWAEEREMDENPLARLYSQFSGVRGPVVIRGRFGDVDPTIIQSSNQLLFAKRAQKAIEERRRRVLQDSTLRRSPTQTTPEPPEPEEQREDTNTRNSTIYTISRICNSTSNSVGDDDDDDDEQEGSVDAVIVEIDVESEPLVTHAPRKVTRINTEQDETPVAQRRPRRKCRK